MWQNLAKTKKVGSEILRDLDETSVKLLGIFVKINQRDRNEKTDKMKDYKFRQWKSYTFKKIIYFLFKEYS